MNDPACLIYRYYGKNYDDQALRSSHASFELPSEIGLALPHDVSLPSVVRHYAYLSLRSLLRKPHLLSLDAAGLAVDDLTRIVLHEYMPADFLRPLIDDVSSVASTDLNTELYMLKLFNSSNELPFFVQLLRSWFKIFYANRRVIDWSTFYESGEMKLTSTASAATATIPSPSPSPRRQQQSEENSSSNGSNDLNNDEVFRLYETFIVEVHQLVRKFHDRLLARTSALSTAVTFARQSSLAARNLLKLQHRSVDDVRLYCIVFHDLFDLLDRFYAVPIATAFLVDSSSLSSSYYRARRDVILHRLDFTRRLLTVHAGFSRVKDWMYLRDLVVSPLTERFDLLATLLANSVDHSLPVLPMKEQMAQYTMSTVLDIRQTNLTLAIHDLVVRYMLRRYFRKGSKFIDSVDPYNTETFSLDLDLINFFVFLVKRCFGSEDFQERFVEPLGLVESSESFGEQLINSSFVFWRNVLAHVAVIAPQTFVSQLLSFVAPLSRFAEIRAHDLLDYVSWLGAGDPFFALFTVSTIERLRTIGERKLHEMFSFLYEQECLLFYVLVEHRFSSLRDRVSHVASLCASGSPLATFNWKNMFESTYNCEVFIGTSGHMFRLVREFFRYIIHRYPRDCSNEFVPSGVLDTIAALVAKRNQRKAGNSRGNGGRKQQRADGCSLFGQDEDFGNYEGCGSGPPSAESLSSSNGGSTVPTHAILWHETDAASSSLYLDVLQRVMNFLNAVLFMFNGVLGNSNGSDCMRAIGAKNVQYLVRKEQGIWLKDKLLRVFGPIFRDFDLDAFQTCSRRPYMSSVPNMVMGNCLSNVQSVNTSFVRVASNQQDQQVIWNLIVRRYEMAAPSLLYLLTLDTVNWNVNEAENFPNTPDLTVNHYVSLVLRNLDIFLADAQRADALSMMLYTRLVPKKRIGDGDASGIIGGDVGPADSARMFAKRVANKLLEDLAEEPASIDGRSTNNGDPSDKGDDATTKQQEEVWSSCSQQSQSQGDGRYVDFIIDRDEFFSLAENLEPVFVTRYCQRLIDDLAAMDDADVVSTVPPLLQLFMLVIQLSRDHRFHEFLSRENLSSVLVDTLMMATVSADWLQKRRISPNGTHHHHHYHHLGTKRPLHASENIEAGAVGNDAEFASAIDRHPIGSSNFAVFVDRSLARLDPSIFAAPVTTRTDSVTTVEDERNANNNLTESNVKRATAIDSHDWSIDSTSVVGSASVVEQELKYRNNALLNKIILEREFLDRVKSLFLDEAFFAWSCESLSLFTVPHIHQLNDRTVLAVFSAYVYALRVFADLPKLSHLVSPLEQRASLASVFRFTSVDNLTRVRAFFPCNFLVNRRTFDLSATMTGWLEQRMRSPSLSASFDARDFATVASANERQRADCDPEDDFDFDDLLNNMVDDQSQEASALSSRLGTVSSTIDNLTLGQSNCGRFDGGRFRIELLPLAYDCNDLPYSVRLAVNYFCLVVFLFCDMDLAVSFYLMRLIVSFLYPGVESRECVIVRGSSGSGKSQFFDLLREFLNSQNGILTTQAISNGGNLINTQFFPLGRNFLCQCDEPKRVDNETFKLLISVVPIAARAFQNQVSQAIPILSKMVLTVNNMFQVESDDGILERLHTVFRLSHKHYNLINEQTDMMRYNCGASYNLAHQICSRIYPRDIDKILFQRGLFHVMHHWSLDQTTRPNASFSLADEYGRLTLDTVLASSSCSTVAHSSGNLLDHRSLQQLWNRRELTRHNDRLAVVNMKIVRNNLTRHVFRSQLNFAGRLVELLSYPPTRELADACIASCASIDDYLCDRNAVRSVFRFQINRRCTNQVALFRSYAFVDAFKRYLSSLSSVEGLLRLFIAEDHLPPFDRLTSHDQQTLVALKPRCRQLDALTCLGLYDRDRKMDLSSLPCTLDLNLIDLQASLDSFVRFKRAYLVEYSSRPMSRDTLRKHLHAYVDEINRSIEDVRYRVKYQEFVDRFETEYAKWRYRRQDNNQFVSSFWSVKLTRVG